MNKRILVLTGVLVICLAGIFFFINNSNKRGRITPPNVGDGGLLPQEQNSASYKGNVLAGNVAPFIIFNKEDYEKAKSENKIIVLDFYANWCPVCRAEEPEIFAGFDSLTSDRIIGFRVNYKDSDTDSDEQAMAREFNIPYQHTKIIVKNGVEVARFSTQWTRQDFSNAVNSALQ
jgi:thiol-disulfide isomerase/thioredoxin